jgi:ADP-heptose:LPS heptosyltransferase
LHTVEDQLTSLKFLGYPVDPIPPLWVPKTPADTQSVKKELVERQLEKGFVLVHPGAAFDTKQWPVEHFATLVTRLKTDGLQVAATAGPGEEVLLKKLAHLTDGGLEVLEPMSLSRLAALVFFCGVFVGNDTGSTHLAAAVKKPVVVIFGSSDSKVWYPWQTEFRLIKSDLACIPCPGYYCAEYSEPRCIRSIEVEKVYRAVWELVPT